MTQMSEIFAKVQGNGKLAKKVQKASNVNEARRREEVRRDLAVRSQFNKNGIRRG